MKGPREIHEAALAARKEVVASLEARANAIATARLLVFGAAIALMVAIVFAHLPSGSWMGVVALVLLFGVLVVVHAKVHGDVRAGIAARPSGDHEQCGRLPPAQVAALLLGGLERGQQALGQLRAGRRVIGADHRRRDGVALHDVRLGAHLVAHCVAGLCDAARARVHGDPAHAIDDRHLPHGFRRIIAGGTVPRSIMLACALTCSPSAWPACSMQRIPVCTATLPPWSTSATCRTASPGSSEMSCWSAAGALCPSRIRSSPRGPNDTSGIDWVATAPTPASAQLTTEPTLKKCDCTATPSSPLDGSLATME